MPTPTTPPHASRWALRKLGLDIKDARKRRRLSMAMVAERAFTSRNTVRRVERGDHTVSVGIYASVLQVLGLLDGLGELASLPNDKLGMMISSADLPKIVRPRLRR